MENKEALQFQRFITKAILQDQTQLVQILMNGITKKKLRQSIRNRVLYEVKLTDEAGEVTLTTPVLQFYITRWEEDIQGILKKLVTCKSQEERESLKTRLKWLYADRQNMNTAPKRERTVYQWLLIPFWLSDLLIDHGEVILRYYGCCWWGISSIVNEHYKRDVVLYDIFVELANNPEHPNIIDNR